jgi:DNA polymerase-1
MNKTVITTKEELTEWFTSIPKVLSFDWETSSLSYLKMEPIGISFCDGERACYVGNMEKEILEFLGTSVFSQRCLFIGHNLKFDCNCCFKFTGCVPIYLFDTFAAAFLLNENRDSYKLKNLVQIDLHVPAKEVMYWEEAETFAKDSQEWYRYCFNDSIWAYGLYLLYAPQLRKENLEYLFYEIEMSFVPVLAYMERTGVSVDKDKLLDLQNHLEKKLIEIEDELLFLCGKKATEQLTFSGVERKLPINFNSSIQVIRVLEGFGLEIPINKKKKKSIDKKLIAPLQGKHPFLDLYLEYKSLEKLYTSYVLPTWDWIDEDGRIRPSFGSARTGRLTCSTPNLQNLPRVSKKHPELNYRAIMQASEGCSLLAPDYSGQELRLLGIVTNDSVILNAFKEGLDLHLLTANRCFNLNLSKQQLTEGHKEFDEAKEKYYEQRYKAKNGANFPIIYGTTAHGVSWRQGVSIGEAQRWIDSFFELYPDVRRAMELTKTELQERGFVTTLFGRRRRFPQYKSLSKYEKEKCLRQAFNFKVQGSAADQVKIAMSKIYQAGYSILLMVHDEVIVEHPSTQAEEAGKDIQKIMEKAVSFQIPFQVEYKIAQNYGSLK